MGTICTSEPLRASTGVSPGFALPPPRSPGFWSHGCDSRPSSDPSPRRFSRLRDCRFPYAFGVNPLKLATAVHSPARVSRRKVQPWFKPLVLPGRPGFLEAYHPLRAAPCVAARFQALFTPRPGVLFTFPSRYSVRYRSRDVFSLGGRFPPTSHGKTKPWYSAPQREPPQFRLRGFHPLRRGIPAHFGYCGSARWGSNPQLWSL